MEKLQSSISLNNIRQESKLTKTRKMAGEEKWWGKKNGGGRKMRILLWIIRSINALVKNFEIPYSTLE